jgi:soluble lytic murein transglycosylase-like protein
MSSTFLPRLRKRAAQAVAVVLLLGCCSCTFERSAQPVLALPRLRRALDTALTWPEPTHLDALAGARLFEDGAPVSYPQIAITRAILRTNPRITATAALELAGATVAAAREHALPAGFLAATLLQESAYDPQALSSAGAVGIAQFELGTAAEYGVNPYDPYDAIAGAAALLSSYVRGYRLQYPDAYAAALAAYNAGPGAVAAYRGIPPYPETQAYIQLIYERWARIASYEKE